jgi:hypothetical protein
MVKELREGYGIKAAKPAAKFSKNQSGRVKLSTFTTESQVGQLDDIEEPFTWGVSGDCTSAQRERSHLLSLNQKEALMLFSLMQAALRHEPTRRTLLSTGDYKQFHRQLSQSLAKSLAAA